MRKSQSKGSPSLAPGQTWKPLSPPTPYRDTVIGAGTPFPRETQPYPFYSDPARGRRVKQVDKRAR
jgi:hypothetical protein